MLLFRIVFDFGVDFKLVFMLMQRERSGSGGGGGSGCCSGASQAAGGQPIRYATGEILMQYNDVPTSAFGMRFGHGLTYGNRMPDDVTAGGGWMSNQPHLILTTIPCPPPQSAPPGTQNLSWFKAAGKDHLWARSGHRLRIQSLRAPERSHAPRRRGRELSHRAGSLLAHLRRHGQLEGQQGELRLFQHQRSYVLDIRAR